MYVLFLVLNETKYLDDILCGFMEIGIQGATILDSQGMASAIVYNEKLHLPFFGSLKNFLDSSHPYNKTIFTVIESEELVEEAVKVVHNIVGDFSKPGVGLMFVLPITKVYGMERESDIE